MRHRWGVTGMTTLDPYDGTRVRPSMSQIQSQGVLEHCLGRPFDQRLIKTPKCSARNTDREGPEGKPALSYKLDRTAVLIRPHAGAIVPFFDISNGSSWCSH